jgi:hypothetical protein
MAIVTLIGKMDVLNQFLFRSHKRAENGKPTWKSLVSSRPHETINCGRGAQSA